MSAACFRVYSASIPGVIHRKRGQACQDKLCWNVTSHGVLLVAVADGAGSAEAAEAGAAMAVQSAVHALAECLQEASAQPSHGLLVEAAERASAAVRDEAERRQVPESHLASTLLLVAATPSQVTSLQIGDGAIVLREASRTLLRLGAAQRGRFANETVFLCSQDAIRHAVLGSFVGPWSELAVVTDGLEVISTTPGSNAPHGPFFHPLFDFAASQAEQAPAEQALHTFLSTPPVSELADDDCALVLASIKR